MEDSVYCNDLFLNFSVFITTSYTSQPCAYITGLAWPRKREAAHFLVCFVSSLRGASQEADHCAIDDESITAQY